MEKRVSDVNSESCIFEFECSSFHGGQINYKIYQGEDGCRIVIRGFNRWRFDTDFLVPEEEIEPLKIIMSGLKWERRYYREGIFDGYKWYLKGWGIESSGYEAYPEGFETIRCIIQNTFTKFLQKSLWRENNSAL